MLAYLRASRCIEPGDDVISTETKNLSASKSRLLFIDDDPAILASLNLLLGDEYDTFSATNARDGIKLFTEIHPEIVLLDLRLPDRSGIEALREIRKLDLTAPVVILTGYSTQAAAEESLRLGATDYINKPFDANELSRKIERLVISGLLRKKEPQSEALIESSVQTFFEFKEFQNASTAFLHDVASPLSCIMAGVEFIGQKLNNRSELSVEDIGPIVQMMSMSTGYLRALLEQWRSFSEIHAMMQSKGQASEAIHIAVEHVKQQIHDASILLIIKNSEEQVYVPGDDFSLGRVLINLLKNAIEAVRPLEGRIQLVSEVKGKTLELTVADNGTGIPKEVIEHIFQPQFSTKPSGKGMGLFISKRIVNALGGDIKARSPGLMGGVDFVVSLPLLEKK